VKATFGIDESKLQSTTDSPLGLGSLSQSWAPQNGTTDITTTIISYHCKIKMQLENAHLMLIKSTNWILNLKSPLQTHNYTSVLGVLCTNPIEVGINLFPGSVLSQLILCPDDSHLTDCACWVSFSNSTGDRCILVEHTGNTWLTVLTCRQTLPHENPVNLQHTKHHPDWKSLILPEISNVSIRYIIKGSSSQTFSH
jgi:hypothetical protein